jgi:hypothetical protein
MPSQRRQCTFSLRKMTDMMVENGTPSWLMMATTDGFESATPAKKKPKPMGPAQSAMMMTCFIRPS